MQSSPGGPGRASHLPARAIAALLALVPLLALAVFVGRHGVNVPYLDQWEIVPLLERSYQGQVTFQDLWAQHNEHRIFFPKLLTLALARLSAWNIRWEMAVNIVLACGLFALFARRVHVTAKNVGLRCWFWLLPLISLEVFSLAQFQNWLWGFQVAMFINVLAVSAGILLLADSKLSWARLAGAAACGFVGTFSFASGLLFWPVALLELLVVTRNSPQRSRSIVVWVVLSLCAIGLFFYRYDGSPDNPPLVAMLGAPIESSKFVFEYLGGLLAQFPGEGPWRGRVALVAGLAGMAALIWAGRKLIRDGTASLNALLPYFSLSLYSFANGVMTAAGRVVLGGDLALASRYGTMAVPFWISLTVLLFLLANRAGPAAETKPSTTHRVIARWALCLLVGMVLMSSVLAQTGALGLARLQEAGRASLLRFERDPHGELDFRSAVALYPKVPVLRERAALLQQRRLSLFSQPY